MYMYMHQAREISRSFFLYMIRVPYRGRKERWAVFLLTFREYLMRFLRIGVLICTVEPFSSITSGKTRKELAPLHVTSKPWLVYYYSRFLSLISSMLRAQLPFTASLHAARASYDPC